jgi:long-chain acyl-CoA synthetase
MSTASATGPMEETLCAAFQASAHRVPDRVALRTFGDSSSAPLTWAGYAAAVERAAGSLASLGVGRGSRVAMLSRNSPELAIAESAVLHLGAIGVVLYAASPPATITHVLRDSEPTVLLIQSDLRARLDGVTHAVGHVCTLDGDSDSDDIPSLAALDTPSSFDFERSWRQTQPDDPAAILYTSGTTGTAKGVECTHRTATSWVASFDAVWPEADGIHDISYGSFANVGERGCGHWRALIKGSTRTICTDPSQLPGALLEARPTFLFGPPQVWQALKRLLESSLQSEERAALQAGIERVRGLAGGRDADALDDGQLEILSTLRRRIGLDRINKSLCAAAMCPPALREHYYGLGVPFGENFAMTEVGSAAAQRAGLIDYGTLGRASPGYELRIADDGELLVRSPLTATRYRNRPAESAETFTPDGWVRTGDLGELDAAQRLRLLGRKKEIIVTAAGHNVAPARLEAALLDSCPLIAHACVLGDGRAHPIAIIVVDPSRGAGADTSTAIAAALDRVNAELDPRERIEAHAIVTDAWLPGAELTETMKMRRPHIAERYTTTIEALYSP